MPFFSPSVLQSKEPLAKHSSRCGVCGLFQGCISPRMIVSGKGRRKILVIAEAPGKEEDKRKTQWIGETGQQFRYYLKTLGVDLDRDCWVINSVNCRSDREPTSKQIEACRPNVIRAIEENNPKKILLVGRCAVNSVLGWLWKENVGTMDRWVGWRIPSQRWNAWICPIYHPGYINDQKRDKDVSKDWSRMLEKMNLRYLARALVGGKRPWKEVPDYRRKVGVERNVEKAVVEVKRFIERGTSVAFDYETNMLKPEGEGAAIKTVSISDGDNTIAFPMHGPAIKVIKEFLLSPLLKYASNMKFEDRWTRAFFGVSVNRWGWDTMLAAHLMDSRPGITGLKFQSFVTLGQESYDDSIKPFLRADGSLVKNRVDEADMGDLLLYNGMDSILTWHLAEAQKKELMR